VARPLIKKRVLRMYRVFFPLPLPGVVSGRYQMPAIVKKFTVELAKNTFLRPYLSYNFGMKIFMITYPIKKHLAMKLI
jgi:hypothetical protein